MSRIITVKYFLVRKLGFSNDDAIQAIENREVRLNEQIALASDKLYPSDDLFFRNELVRKGKTLVYLAFYKPRGVESTMNKQIDSGLTGCLPDIDGLFPVGRLDKESEGLMLITNDGHLYKDLALSEAGKEKEYQVTVDKAITNEQLHQLAEGVVIMGQMTRKAAVRRINENSFSIILTQGLNRQIRRMCYKLHLEVTRLIRTRIDTLSIGNLEPGELRDLTADEVSGLLKYRLHSTGSSHN